jgi:glycosyltransferase involved in cell wall biosynthesis
MMKKVSVVIPIHNSERYLRECLDSAIGQSLQDIEFICVDSSCDSSRAILDEYAQKDSRIIIISDENSSYGHKINVGIREAKGEYFGILESDDYVDPLMYETMYSLASKNNVDVIKGENEGFAYWNGQRICVKTAARKEKDFNRFIDFEKEPDNRKLIENVPCCALYRTQFLRTNRILVHESPGASYQDNGFSLLVALFAKNAYFISDGFYKYRQDNPGSSIHNKDKSGRIIKEYEWIKDQMTLRNLMSDENRRLYHQRKVGSYSWILNTLPQEKREIFCADVYDDLCEIGQDQLLPKDCKEKIELLQNKEKRDRHVKETEQFYKNFKQTVTALCKGKVILFGLDVFGKRVVELQEMLGIHGIVCICDHDSEPGEYHGIPVVSPEEAIQFAPDSTYIIAGKKNEQEMNAELNGLGIANERIIKCGNISTRLKLLRDVLTTQN